MAKNDLPDEKKIIQRILDLLKQLIEEAERVGMPVPQHIKDDFHKYDDEYRTIKSKKKLSIAVAGKFSSGKSKFINSLLNINIAPVNIDPTTRCRTVFTYKPSLRLKKGEVRIFNSNGDTVSKDEYQKMAAKASSSGNAFAVYVSDNFWKEVELVDTPGYNPASDGHECNPDVDGCSDAEISQAAVKDADIVFFICACNDGELGIISSKYIKESLNDNQELYIVLNKADLVEDELSEIAKYIKAECQRLRIKYESIFPYCSLTDPNDEDLKALSPEWGKHILHLAKSLRKEARKIINNLVAQSQSKIARINLRIECDLKTDLTKFAHECIRSVEDFKQQRFKRIDGDSNIDEDGDYINVEDLTDSIVIELRKMSVKYTEAQLRFLLQKHELTSTRFFGFFKKWVVFLCNSRTTYVLTDDDRENLSTQITDILRKGGIQSSKLSDKIISCFEACSNEVMAKYGIRTESPPSSPDNDKYFEEQSRSKADYCVICRKSDCPKNEQEIKERLWRSYPITFKKICSPRIQGIINTVLEDFQQEKRESLKRQFDLCDSYVCQLKEAITEKAFCHVADDNKDPKKVFRDWLESVDWRPFRTWFGKLKSGCRETWQELRSWILKKDST